VATIQTSRTSHRFIEQFSRASLLCGSALIMVAPLGAAPAGDAQAKPANGAAAKHLKPAPTVPDEARISLARARQLEQVGVNGLAERQLLHAVSMDPRGPEAQRELARFYTRRALWREAAASWRNVLFLVRSDAEARAQFGLASRMVSAQQPVPSFARNIVELGQNSGSTRSGSGSFYMRGVARVTPRNPRPRLAQSDVASSTPNSMTGGEATTAPETASTIANGVTASPDRQSNTATKEPPLPPPKISLGSATTVGRRPVPLTPTTSTQRAAAVRSSTTTSTTATRSAATASRAQAGQARVSARNQAAAWPLVERATRALQAREYGAALAFYQRAAALDPNNVYARYGVPDTLTILKRYTDAERGVPALAPNGAQRLEGAAWAGRCADVSSEVSAGHRGISNIARAPAQRFLRSITSWRKFSLGPSAMMKPTTTIGPR
jgi:tetratricopeptide (TPR) repeat protein